MNLFNLTPDALEEYVAENRRFDGTWVFHHIPKTAGSSLGGELAQHAQPYHNILPDYTDMARPFADRVNQSVTDFITAANAPGQSIRSASGHILSSHLGRIKGEIPKIRAFTFLRHPVSRIVSEYSYNCSPSHPPHKEFKAAYPTFESFIEHPAEQNKQAFYLFESRNIPVDIAIAELGRRYSLVGLQERYPVSFLMISAMIWKPTLPKMRQRVGDKNEKLEISRDLRRYIIEKNALDMELYHATDKLLDSLASAIWSKLKPEQPE